MMRWFSLEGATDLAARAVRAAGASSDAAQSLAQATVSANAHGKEFERLFPSHGLSDAPCGPGE